MKSALPKIFVFTACLVAAGSAALATPLQRGDVAAEPAWVVHVDCDGLRSTVMGQFIFSELEKPEAQAKLASFQSIFNLDPRKQIHGLTLYSTGQLPEDGVLLLYADFDADRLATMVKAAHDYQSANHNQHVVHSWAEEHKGHNGHEKARAAASAGSTRTYAAVHKGRVIVFGQREAGVAAALDVLDHSAPSLSGTQSFAHLGAAGKDTLVQAAACKFDLPGSDPSAQLFKLAKSARLQIGEANQQLMLHVDLEAKDEEVAKYMVKIGQGLLALVKLQNEKADSVKLANALSLKQDGAQLQATLQLPAADVVAMMKADAAENAKGHKTK